MSSNRPRSSIWANGAICSWKPRPRLELASTNANEPAIALCLLTLAWMHVEAMDFEGACELCEDVDDSVFRETQFAIFFKRAVLAKAFVGMNDLVRAREQFEDIRRCMEDDGIPIDFTIATQLYHCLGEYCLKIGDMAQARKWAKQLHDYVAPAPDHNHLAQAYGLFARIAFASGDPAEALVHLSRALGIVDNADFPLASWRIYYAAAEIYSKCGEADKAATYRIRFVDVMRRLARNFEPDDHLHKTLTTTLKTRTARLEAMA